MEPLPNATDAMMADRIDTRGDHWESQPRMLDLVGLAELGETVHLVCLPELSAMADSVAIGTAIAQVRRAVN